MIFFFYFCHKTFLEVISVSIPKDIFWSGLWNYQILLLVNGQVNGQNPLVQPRLTCLKIDIFLSSQRKHNYVVVTHQKRFDEVHLMST